MTTAKALTSGVQSDVDRARPVLSVAEAADLLGVSQWLLLQQIRLGNIPHKRCGRRIVISRARLMSWMVEDND